MFTIAFYLQCAPNRVQKSDAGWESVRWLVIGITLLKNREIGKISFHVLWSKLNSYPSFWRNSAGKLMSGDSSSSTFHEFQEFIIFNYQDFKSSNLRIFKFRNFKSSNFEISKTENSGTQDFQKVWDFQILIYPKSIFSKDVPIFSLYFLKYFDGEHGVQG